MKNKNELTANIIPKVDLSTCPDSNPIDSDTTYHVTLGDLHANAIYLIYFLIKEGAISGISNAQYNELFEIYKKNVDNISDIDIKKFNEIINKSEVNPQVIPILIGDLLADRGQNDYWVIVILRHLLTNNPQTRIVFSNHDAEFVMRYENVLQKKDIVFFAGAETDDNVFGNAIAVFNDQARSINNMYILLKAELIDINEINSFMKIYKQSVKIIDYTTNQDDPDTIILYSHAPAGLKTIKSLAELMNIQYNDETIQTLTKTIDDINEKFKLDLGIFL